jgi:hypothetical protein
LEGIPKKQLAYKVIQAKLKKKDEFTLGWHGEGELLTWMVNAVCKKRAKRRSEFQHITLIVIYLLCPHHHHLVRPVYRASSLSCLSISISTVRMDQNESWMQWRGLPCSSSYLSTMREEMISIRGLSEEIKTTKEYGEEEGKKK